MTAAWEQAAREARRAEKEVERRNSTRELRRASPREVALVEAGDHGGSSSSAAPPQGDGDIVQRRDRKRPTMSLVGEAIMDTVDTRDSGGSSLSGLKMKAIAGKFRHKVHAQSELHRKMSSAGYATIDAEALVDGEQTASDGEHGRARLSQSAKDMAALGSILRHPFTVLLLACPLGVVAHLRRWGALCTFWLNMVALVPLAKILGDGTEELAASIKNDTISGFLNATLGNAVEMILSVQTLRKGLLSVVKATLLGSILSNILLVLGTSFLLGGIVGSKTVVGKHHVIYNEDFQVSTCTGEKEQLFSSKSALVSMGMQLIACMTCALPTVFYCGGGLSHGHGSEVGPDMQAQKMLEVSRISAIIIMLSYVAYVVFQLVTHKRMLTVDEGAESDEEEDEDSGMSWWSALILMGATTGIIAVSSEMLVGAIEEVVEKSSISSSFIGIILLPFAGNACEHASAIRFAMQDRPGLSIGIAVGSSTQIALFVVPFTVVMGWFLDQPMDLVFGAMNMSVMILSVLVALVMVIDGRSNWLKGFMLCTAYLFEAVLYWSMPDE